MFRPGVGRRTTTPKSGDESPHSKTAATVERKPLWPRFCEPRRNGHGSRREAGALAQEGGATLDHPPLLLDGQLREHRQGQDGPAGLLAGGEVALGVAEVGEALLAVQRDG